MRPDRRPVCAHEADRLSTRRDAAPGVGCGGVAGSGVRWYALGVIAREASPRVGRRRRPEVALRPVCRIAPLPSLGADMGASLEGGKIAL